VKWFSTVLLYWRTIRHLRIIQIKTRIEKKLYKIVLKYDAPASVSNFVPNITWLDKKKSIISDKEFCFLNNTVGLHFPQGWNDQDQSLLWLYNLHYFDGLINEETLFETKIKLIRNWIISNNDESKIGWDPYPSSLRIVNWIKFFWSNQINETDMQISLCQQVRYLDQNIEYNLLGNHLLENAKALIFSGCYFAGEEANQWLEKGLSILEKELEEQILNDGAHFELSPMYHSIVLELLIDLYSLSINQNSPPSLQLKKEELRKYISRMAEWLSIMTHPDMEISFFNDSAIGIAQSPQTLFSKIKKLKILIENKNAHPIVFLKESGYIRAKKDKATLFFDVGNIGPSYLPGHGHADALSIELSINKDRIFTNLGTSEYGLASRRDFERSTAAHSTLELGGKSSSEVWAGFRVGRRAKVRNQSITIDEDEIILSAEHDGYRYLKDKPVHKRTIQLFTKRLVIKDEINSGDLNAIIRFHLHPSINLIMNSDGLSGHLETKLGDQYEWSAIADYISIEKHKFAPNFGILIPTQTICLYQEVNRATSFMLNWF